LTPLPEEKSEEGFERYSPKNSFWVAEGRTFGDKEAKQKNLKLKIHRMTTKVNKTENLTNKSFSSVVPKPDPAMQFPNPMRGAIADQKVNLGQLDGGKLSDYSKNSKNSSKTPSKVIKGNKVENKAFSKKLTTAAKLSLSSVKVNEKTKGGPAKSSPLKTGLGCITKSQNKPATLSVKNLNSPVLAGKRVKTESRSPAAKLSELTVGGANTLFKNSDPKGTKSSSIPHSERSKSGKTKVVYSFLKKEKLSANTSSDSQSDKYVRQKKKRVPSFRD